MIHVDNQFDENRERQIMRQAEIQVTCVCVNKLLVGLVVQVIKF